MHRKLDSGTHLSVISLEKHRRFDPSPFEQGDRVDDTKTCKSVSYANRHYITAVTRKQALSLSLSLSSSLDHLNFTAVPILHGYRIYGTP